MAIDMDKAIEAVDEIAKTYSDLAQLVSVPLLDATAAQHKFSGKHD
ncbi:hypothetical protein GCM10007385_37670 [Tateyamaria omphalii]|nr:hypothetical protein [Tateyamaria omphalii]GGX64999.1 hypothetical protein GCM10007385_37670 [Tateyamaria omphalii]